MNKHNDLFSDYLINPFAKAWDLFFDIRFPVRQYIDGDYDVSEEYDSSVLYYIPVVGLVIGLLSYFFAWVICFFTGNLIATILCPFVIVIFVEYLNHGKDSYNLINFLNSKLHANIKHGENKHVDYNLHTDFMYFYIFSGIFLIRLFKTSKLL